MGVLKPEIMISSEPSLPRDNCNPECTFRDGGKGDTGASPVHEENKYLDIFIRWLLCNRAPIDFSTSGRAYLSRLVSKLQNQSNEFLSRNQFNICRMYFCYVYFKYAIGVIGISNLVNAKLNDKQIQLLGPGKWARNFCRVMDYLRSVLMNDYRQLFFQMHFFVPNDQGLCKCTVGTKVIRMKI